MRTSKVIYPRVGCWPTAVSQQCLRALPNAGNVEAAPVGAAAIEATDPGLNIMVA
jgi:hypothetical protein